MRITDLAEGRKFRPSERFEVKKMFDFKLLYDVDQFGGKIKLKVVGKINKIKNMKKIIISTLVLVLALTMFWPLTGFGIGQMTEPIIIENARQGEIFEKTLYLFNTEEGEDVFKIKAENDVAQWVKFYDPKNLETPIEEINIPGNSRYDIVAKFLIPKGTPNGEYVGVVGVAVFSKNEELEEDILTTVSQKIDREVKITITDKEEISVKTSIIPKTYNLKTGEPLSIRIIYDNQSNIKIRPQVQVKLKSDGKTVHNVIYPFPEELDSVNSFSMKEITPLEIQTTGMKDGKYLAEMSVIVDEKNKYDSQFSFSIGVADKEGNDSFSSFILQIGGGSTPLGLLFAGGFILLLSIILIARMRRKTRN